MKALLILLLILLLPLITPSQLLEENFDYALGKLTTVSSTWSESPIGSVDIQVVTGNLSYAGYPSSNIGNMIFLDGGASGRSGVRREFTKITGNGNTVYCSFLLNAADLTDLDNNLSSGDYLGNFQTVGSTIKCYLYVRLGSTANTLNFGLAKSSSTSLTWINSDYGYSSTHLIVMAYSFQSGDDAVKLWVNPDLSGSEPVPDVEITSGTDADTLMYIQYRQRTASGNFNVDGIRVSTSWSTAPLPVELTSFTASVLNKQVILNWKTATEINNYGFEIERGAEFSESAIDWNTIGFVEGHGNSNSPHEYFFIDESPGMGRVSYRLKQIDFDGQYEYSDVVAVNIESKEYLVLLPNYPNPFNPETRVSFYLKNNTRMDISLYNILGEKIKDLALNKLYNSGFNSFLLLGKNLTGGVYFIEFNSAKFRKTQKILLSK